MHEGGEALRSTLSSVGFRARANTARRVIDGELHLVPFAERRQAWERVVEAAPNASLYHRPQWLDLLSRSYGFKLYFAGVGDSDSPSAACVLAKPANPFAGRLVALPCSDFCPPLEVDSASTTSLLKILADSRATRGFELRGVSALPPWHTVDTYALWTLNLDVSLAALERGFHSSFYRRLRQARRAAIKVERGRSLAHLKRFYRLYELGRRRLGVPAQPMRFFHLAREIFGERLEIWLASHNGRDLVTDMILHDGSVVYYRWNARRLDAPPGAGHLLLWNTFEEFVGQRALADFGRTDVRNRGLVAFKAAMGARARPLPYAFFPKAPASVSAEVMEGPTYLLSRLWRRLPLGVVRKLSAVLYRYLV
jgi:hypothetical protein